MPRIQTIDAEVSGEPLRLITGGGPAVVGRSMSQKLAWLRRHGDELRTTLMLEPRGHAGMHGALLTEPVSPGAHAGILFMNAGGFPEFSGEGVIGAVTIALQNRLIVPGDGVSELVIDTPAATVRASTQITDGQVQDMRLSGIASYVHSAGLPIHVGGRRVPVDVAFSGGCYAIADSESIGVPIDLDHGAELIRKAMEIRVAVASVLQMTHPIGAILTSPARGDADLRSATVVEGGVLKRSPGVSSTSALMAVLDAMGLMGEGPFVHEGLIGTAIQGEVQSRHQQDGVPMVVPAITGSATVTGYHEFVF